MSQAQVERRADSIRRRVESYSRAAALADAIGDLPQATADLDDTGIPPLVHVSVDDMFMPAALVDVIEAYGAEVAPDSIGGEGISFTLRVPDLFSPVGRRDFRKSGNSIIVRFPHGALERANFDVGDDVEILASDGAVLLVEVDE